MIYLLSQWWFFVNDFELKKCDFDGISYATIGINIHS